MTIRRWSVGDANTYRSNDRYKPGVFSYWMIVIAVSVGLLNVIQRRGSDYMNVVQMTEFLSPSG